MMLRHSGTLKFVLVLYCTLGCAMTSMGLRLVRSVYTGRFVFLYELTGLDQLFLAAYKHGMSLPTRGLLSVVIVTQTGDPCGRDIRISHSRF